MRRTIRVPTVMKRFLAWFKQQMPVLDLKDLFPLGIRVSKGVITCGNHSTPSLLVAEFGVCHGTFGITQVSVLVGQFIRTIHIVYRLGPSVTFTNRLSLSNFAMLSYSWQRMNNLLIQFRLLGSCYMTALTSTLHLILTHPTAISLLGRYPIFRSASSHLTYHSFQHVWRQLSFFPLTLKYGQNRQRQRNFRAHTAKSKHRKAIEEETSISSDFSTLEYAVERKVLETPLLELTYLADVVGDVPPIEEQSYPKQYDFGNGDISPDWLLEFVIHRGIFRYGPWADRQR